MKNKNNSNTKVTKKKKKSETMQIPLVQKRFSSAGLAPETSKRASLCPIHWLTSNLICSTSFQSMR